MSSGTTRTDTTPIVVATWALALHGGGRMASDQWIREACAGVASTTDPTSGAAAAEALVAAVRERLTGPDPAAVLAFAREAWGDASADLGDGIREERVQRIRRYQFERNLPWLARLWERDSAGEVRPIWLIVERFTDTVVAMDPNPWDEIEELRRFPVDSFQALWELEACASVRVY